MVDSNLDQKTQELINSYKSCLASYESQLADRISKMYSPSSRIGPMPEVYQFMQREFLNDPMRNYLIRQIAELYCTLPPQPVIVKHQWLQEA